MNNLRFSRRNLLHAAGLGTAANMLLPELRNTSYAAEAIPKMFLMFYTHHGYGVNKSDWGSGEGGMTLGPSLQPLAPFKNDIVMVSDLDMKSAALYAGNNMAGHIQGQVHSLTSKKPATPVENEGSKPNAGGPSIDQAILNALKRKNGGNQLTEVDSLQMGIANSFPGNDQMMGRSGYKEVSPGVITKMGYINNPKDAYEVAFKSYDATGGSQPAASVPGKEDPSRLQRRLMAQFAKGQFDSVSSKVGNLYGSESQQRFKAHADYMTSLERSLAQIDAGGGGSMGGASDKPLSAMGCKLPSALEISKMAKPTVDWVDVLSENMPKVAHLALACGRTRFATIVVEATVVPGDIHSKVHAGDRPGTQGYYVKVAEQVAKTIKLLKDSPTADGKNMLYHTVFLWAGELGSGKDHSFDDLQWVIGGQAGGALQTGRFVNGKGKTNADLFLSLAKLMDADLPTFGDPAAVTGPISAIKA